MYRNRDQYSTYKQLYDLPNSYKIKNENTYLIFGNQTVGVQYRPFKQRFCGICNHDTTYLSPYSFGQRSV